MRRVLIGVLLVLIASGCSTVRGLMEYSNEQDALQRYVSDQKKKMARLFIDIEEDKLVVGTMTAQDVRRLYGDPILIKQIDMSEEWLYRETMDYFTSQKAYLLFDYKGVLVNIRVPSDNS